jgi:hypothetical protein
VKTKCCRRCDQTKPCSEFNYHPHTLDRCESYCTTCRAEYNRAWRHARKEAKLAAERAAAKPKAPARVPSWQKWAAIAAQAAAEA